MHLSRCVYLIVHAHSLLKSTSLAEKKILWHGQAWGGGGGGVGVGLNHFVEYSVQTKRVWLMLPVYVPSACIVQVCPSHVHVNCL